MPPDMQVKVIWVMLSGNLDPCRQVKVTVSPSVVWVVSSTTGGLVHSGAPKQ